MEELLNKLIEKGWRPFGDEKIHSFEIIYITGEIWNIVAKRGRGQVNKHYSIRDVVSKESGLWQFVCENELYPPYIQHRWFRDLPTNGLQIHDYRYWVIESALCDEDKLEDFILDNIKIDG